MPNDDAEALAEAINNRDSAQVPEDHRQPTDTDALGRPLVRPEVEKAFPAPGVRTHPKATPCTCAFKGPGQHNKGCVYYETAPMTPEQRHESDRHYTDARVDFVSLYVHLRHLSSDFNIQAATDALRLLDRQLDNALARVRQELNDRP